jgi:single-strand DNA-binding protein
MSADNNFVGIGNLGKDAQSGYTPNGTYKTFFSIAINEVRGTGENRTEETHWIPCVWFGPRAQKVETYLLKGTMVAVSGRISTYKKEGVDRFQINVDDVRLMPKNSTTPSEAPTLNEDEVPF